MLARMRMLRWGDSEAILIRLKALCKGNRARGVLLPLCDIHGQCASGSGRIQIHLHLTFPSNENEGLIRHSISPSTDHSRSHCLEEFNTLVI